MKNRVRSLIGEARLVVAGSLLEGEERALLKAWPAMQADGPEAVLLLAPRHPARFNDVVEMVRSSDCDVLRCSTLKGTDGRISNGTVLVLDTLGDLAAVYGLADVAFVGGSLVPRGGHNPLEPAQFGVPVVMGPSYENFRDIVAKMQAADGIRIVRDKVGLEAALVDLLNDRETAKAMGEHGRKVFEAQSGATARAVAALTGLVKQ
jgi:3-deoxy-D-manno-octulosonic-acid transferase